MGLLARVFGLGATKAAEGAYRDGPWSLPISGGWIGNETGGAWNFWQLGYSPTSGGGSAMVEACISAYAQTVAMCPGDHWRTESDGGRKRVSSSALSRILRQPNDYQSISDFLLNLTWSLFLNGNAYALALRNDRYEITELHLMSASQSTAKIAATGEVFYQLSGNPIIERRLGLDQSSRALMVPARDVLHVRLRTPDHPLVGESPLRAAALAEMASGAMLSQQVRFYLNQGRPSSVLTTDQKLTPEQAKQLRQLWDEQSKGLNQGGTPILTAGLKPAPWSISPQDAQLAEIMRLTDQQVALAFRVPLAILGISAGGQQGGAKSSTESLTKEWKSQGLGFALNHIEEAFGQTFGLRGQPDEYVEFSTDALLRPSMKERLEALSAGTLGGIFAPDEARASEGLPKVPGGFGKEPRMQAQVVPLSAAGAIPTAPAAPASPAPSLDGDTHLDFDPAGFRQRLQKARADAVAA